jgi:uncharacterized surface protein with fasciclin (FAS1) repeats
LPVEVSCRCHRAGTTRCSARRVTAAKTAGPVDTLNRKHGISVEGSGEDFAVNGSAKVLWGNVQTGNATVHVTETVLLPTS